MVQGSRLLNDNGGVLGLNTLDLIGAVGVLVAAAEGLRPLGLGVAAQHAEARARRVEHHQGVGVGERRRGIEEIGDQRVLARSLWGLGLVDQLDGKLHEADRKMEESLRIS
jgi:hypothetical protein